MTKTIIRISFARGSNNIRVGLTKLNNLTIVGEIVWSENLTLSYYNTFVDVDSSNVLGGVGTIVFPNNEKGETLINSINEIQSKRVSNMKGNKYPFVFLTIEDVELIIFNKGAEPQKDRLSFVNVVASQVKVDSNPPQEVLNLINNNSTLPLPVINSSSSTAIAKTIINNYGTSEDNPDCEPHKAITLVSAYLVEQGLILKPQEVENKSNEITAVPKLIESLALKGVVVAFDAMNTQKNYCDYCK